METTVKLKLGFAALMIVSGIGVAMYPVVSNAVAQRHASSVIESYNDTVQSMDAEKIDAAKEATRRYNQQLNNAIDRDAAGEADDIGTSYVDMLDVGESLGYITIPKIDVNLPIYEGTSDDVLVKGVGHLEGSSYPLGGAGTHSVLTGHRGLDEAVLFTDLDRLGAGDRKTPRIWKLSPAGTTARWSPAHPMPLTPTVCLCAAPVCRIPERMSSPTHRRPCSTNS